MKTVELGRAVINFPENNVQLWSTTFITLSPLQTSIDLHSLNHQLLSRLLVSGKIWTCRGVDFQLRIEILVHGEQLGPSELNRLAEQLVDAPVWPQLRLHVFLPMPCVEHGNIRINIRHIREDVEGAHTQLHRLFSGVPSADMQPPDHVNVLGLQSVQLQVDLRSLEQLPSWGIKSDNSSKHSIGESDASENTLKETIQGTKKRKRPVLHTRQQPRGAASPDSSPGAKSWEDDHSVPIFEKGIFSSTINMKDLGMFIDCALRVSVCEQVPKLPGKAKVIVKNFTTSLAEVCPAIWSPGYISVFSQRTRLVPTISRSLLKLTNGGTVSSTLQNKIALLAKSSSTEISELTSSDSVQSHGDGQPSESSETTMNSRLWIHTHTRMPRKLKKPLKQFFVLPSSTPDEEEMLDRALSPSFDDTSRASRKPYSPGRDVAHIESSFSVSDSIQHDGTDRGIHESTLFKSSQSEVIHDNNLPLALADVNGESYLRGDLLLSKNLAVATFPQEEDPGDATANIGMKQGGKTSHDSNYITSTHSNSSNRTTEHICGGILRPNRPVKPLRAVSPATMDSEDITLFDDNAVALKKDSISKSS